MKMFLDKMILLPSSILKYEYKKKKKMLLYLCFLSGVKVKKMKKKEYTKPKQKMMITHSKQVCSHLILLWVKPDKTSNMLMTSANYIFNLFTLGKFCVFFIY